jgi:hypothetical protein
VQVLVTAGVEKDRPDNYGHTPLAYVIMYDNPALAEYLLQVGAKISKVKRCIKVPDWMHQLVKKRETVMCCTRVLKGVLKRRRGIVKDVTHLIALYFWSMRLK